MNLLEYATYAANISDEEIERLADGDAEIHLGWIFERDFWKDFNSSLIKEMQEEYLAKP